MNNWAMLISFISGGFVTAVLSHFLAADTSRMNRKIDLRGFLGRWMGFITHSTDVSKTYSENLEHLWGYYGKCRKDFISRWRFKKLCQRLGSLKAEDIQKDQERHRAVITEMIQELIDYV